MDLEYLYKKPLICELGGFVNVLHDADIHAIPISERR